MFRRTASRIAIASVPALIAGGALAAPASAQTGPAASHGAGIPVQLIGPNQYFSGYINGSPPGQAIVRTDCFGAVQPGQTGHPLPNQTVEVQLASPAGSIADLGYTGNVSSTASESIVATLGPSAAASSVIGTFTAYGVIEEIPTTVTVPCGGPGVATFSPSPASPGSFPATLNVTFQGQP
jgi:hypothetical protein